MDSKTPVSNLNMDFDNNKRYFDPANAKKIKKIMIAAVPFLALAVVFILLGRFWMRMCLVPLIIGGALGFYALSKYVKEGEVTHYLHQAKKDVRVICGEALGYPSDLEAESELFMGAVTGDKLPEDAFPAKKLKDGRMLTQEVQFTYIYARKTGLYVFTRVLSLIEDKVIDSEREIPYAEFDKAFIEPVGSGNKANILKIALGKEIVFEAPLFSNDYEQDEFLATMLHTRERAMKE